MDTERSWLIGFKEGPCIRGLFNRRGTGGLLAFLLFVPGAMSQIATSGNYSQPYVIKTLAGGAAGSDDGNVASAQFLGPSAVAVDGSGNLYVADTGNETIRKITPAGVVSTLAGQAGKSGDVDDVGTAARFDRPEGIAVDSSGTVYVADTNNGAIREISPSGNVTTLASQMGEPAGVTVDSAGNVYVADASDIGLVEKVTAGGVVTTLAGGGVGASGYYQDGTGSAAAFYQPKGVAVDNSGSIYVADTGNHRIRKITPTPVGGVTTWVVSTLAGGREDFYSVDGTGSAAVFMGPTAVALDGAGNVYVADSGGETIRKVTPAGSVTTLAGGDTYVGGPLPLGGVIWGSQPGDADGTGNHALFDDPVGVAASPAGDIYVADTGNNSIRSGHAAMVPLIVVQPIDQIVSPGQTTVLSIQVTDESAATFGWIYSSNGGSTWAKLADGSGVSGSAGPQLVIQGASAAEVGEYACVVSFTGGSVQSAPAALSVQNSSSPGTLTSVSARAFVGTGDNILIGGFYITGSTSATVLVQAIGPALAAAPYNVTGTLQHPALTIHQNQSGKDVVLYSNTGWGSSPVLLAAAAAAYAEPVLQQGSPDSELLLTLPPGGYTAEVTGADGDTGVALCAIYQVQ